MNASVSIYAYSLYVCITWMYGVFLSLQGTKISGMLAVIKDDREKDFDLLSGLFSGGFVISLVSIVLVAKRFAECIVRDENLNRSECSRIGKSLCCCSSICIISCLITISKNFKRQIGSTDPRADTSAIDSVEDFTSYCWYGIAVNSVHILYLIVIIGKTIHHILERLFNKCLEFCPDEQIEGVVVAVEVQKPLEEGQV